MGERADGVGADAMTQPRPFFIVGCARSGTTSLARILDNADNGFCLIEPAPNLNRETRLAMDAVPLERDQVVRRLIMPRLAERGERGRVYGEKSITLAPFVAEVYALTGCRFVYVYRDGRDVVRSLMDWHELVFGTVYREAPDAGDLAPIALARAAALPAWLDMSDYSRPRPRPGSALYDLWETMPREEMCAWYWSTVNELYLDQLEQLPRSAWLSIDYTQPQASSVLEVARFVGLSGLTEAGVAQSLAARINSAMDRERAADRYPRWPHWSRSRAERFEHLAGATMRRLGHFQALTG
jgi:hypothetical protein